jgi:hypothetical protein
MTPDAGARRPARLAAAAALALLVALSPPAAAQEPAAPAPPVPRTEETCEGCHALDRAAKLALPDGTVLSVWVDVTALGHSVHGHDLRCIDCHRSHRGYPHAPVRAQTAAEYRRTQSNTCSPCHYAHFTRVLDGIHYKELAAGKVEAPTCIDCHGGHEVAPASKPRLGISQKCARCHEDEAAVYRGSVHGKALARGDDNVPVCTDCHGAHDIVDPRTRDFHASSYLICARCHGDADLMKKYDLSSDVLTTYVDDFHGSSNVLYTKIGYLPDRPMATCTDCHGTHDIARFDRSGGDDAVRTRVVAMCRNCHRDAPEDFARAWLSHSSPTLARTPLVWSVTWAYRILIPFIMLGLIMHILLDLWRIRPHRRRTGMKKE